MVKQLDDLVVKIMDEVKISVQKIKNVRKTRKLLLSQTHIRRNRCSDLDIHIKTSFRNRNFNLMGAVR